jgi:hypothetical protein
MNISLEYLQRTGVLKDIASYPCSLFLTHPYNNNKIVIVVDRRGDKFILRQWDVFACEADQILPPLKETVVENPFEAKFIPFGYILFDCRTQSIPWRENGVTHPMKQDRYYAYFDNICQNNFIRHNEAKDRWLWAAFISIYHPELLVYSMSVKRSLNFYSSYGESEIINDQKQIVDTNFPRDWKCWNIWRRHMLDYMGVPGEYLFRHAYQCGIIKESSRLGNGM